MDDGCKTQNGLRLVTNNFNYLEIQELCNLLFIKFNLYTSIHNTGPNKGYIIYIKRKSVSDFINIINPFIHTSMRYKIINYIVFKPKKDINY
jgi:hypothetical protein